MPRGYSELIEIAPTALLDLVDDVRRKWSNLTPEEDSHVRRWQSQARRLILQCFNLIATGNIFGLERDSPAVKVPHYEYGRLDVQLRSLLSDIGPGRACPTPSSLPSINRSINYEAHLAREGPKMWDVLITYYMINLALSAYLQVAGELPYSPEDFVQFQHRAGLRALEESVLAAVHHGWNTLSKLEQIGVDRTFEHIISKNCEPTSNIRALFNKEVSKARLSPHSTDPQTALGRLLDKAGFVAVDPRTGTSAQHDANTTQLSLRKQNMYFPTHSPTPL